MQTKLRRFLCLCLALVMSMTLVMPLSARAVEGDGTPAEGAGGQTATENDSKYQVKIGKTVSETDLMPSRKKTKAMWNCAA